MRKTILFVLVVFLLLAFGVGNNAASFAATASPEDAADLLSLDARAGRTPVSAEEGETIARNHLQSNSQSFGVSADDVASLRVTDNIVLRSSGARVVYFQQTVDGIGVHNGVFNVTVTDKGDVIFVGNRGVANLQGAVNARAATISPQEAIAGAATALKLSYTPDSLVQETEARGVEQEVLYSGGDLSLESIPVKLAYQPMADSSLRLTWDLNIYQHDGQHWWHVRIDATTGELLDTVDWVVNENFDELIESGAVEHNTYQPVNVLEASPLQFGVADGSSYKVYPIPVESPNHTSPLPPSDARVTIAEPADPTASPYGWHDTNGATGAEYTVTRGNNVWAGLDVASPNGIDTGSEASGGSGLDFIHTISLGSAPSTYRPAAVTNLFVWNNYMHDVSYLYGFDEAAGNFQSNNYGRGGSAGDYVRAEAQDYSGTNNANFATPPDGQLPRMQMYIGTTPNPDVDGDLDNGVVAHEYGHGISNRLTGGRTNTSCLGNQEQAGEGWSDWQALLFTMKSGDTGPQARGIGTYLFGQAPTGGGIRPAPYSTNMSVNNYTYNNRTGVAVPHGVGFLFATMLWEVNWNLIGQHGFNPNIYGAWNTGGNNLAYQLVQDGMAIQPCSPGFVDARNAILAADQALTGGANQCLIWQGFAKRGLGNSASQGSSNSLSDGSAAFDLPAACSGATPTPNPTNTPVSPTNTPVGPTNTPVPPTATPGSGTITYTGSLPGTGSNAYHPTEGYSSVAGTHTGSLTGTGTDFDLYLQRLNGSSWTTVASSLGSTSTENISYNGTAGTYRWRVYSYSGSGTYTLVTTRPGSGPAPTNTPVPPTATPVPPTPTPSGGYTYTGTLSGTGASNYHPDGSYYYSASSGTHTGDLVGPVGTDFDLYLQRWNGSSWANVASGLSGDSTEYVSYNGASGYYRWRVYSYSGSGSYTLVTTRPAGLVEGGLQPGAPTAGAAEEGPVLKK